MEEYQGSYRSMQLQFGKELSEETVIKVQRSTPGQTEQVDKDNKPLRQKPYRIPQAYREKVIAQLEEMRIIEETTSEWAFPLVIVSKKNGGVRVCVDYRKLNHITKFDAYPMPRIKELLDKIGSAEFLTTLDLTKGYWQVLVQPQDKPKTAFVGTLPVCYHPIWTKRCSGYQPTYDGQTVKWDGVICWSVLR